MNEPTGNSDICCQFLSGCWWENFSEDVNFPVENLLLSLALARFQWWPGVVLLASYLLF